MLSPFKDGEILFLKERIVKVIVKRVKVDAKDDSRGTVVLVTFVSIKWSRLSGIREYKGGCPNRSVRSKKTVNGVSRRSEIGG